jgi:hypothetical protein
MEYSNRNLEDRLSENVTSFFAYSFRFILLSLSRFVMCLINSLDKWHRDLKSVLPY